MASEHTTRSSSKDAIRYRNFRNRTEEKMQRERARHHVSEVRRISTRTDNVYILTFDICTVSLEVKIGWTKLIVQEYVPT